jgi:hypothetical protein
MSGILMSSDKRPPKRPTFTEQEALQFHQRGKPGKLEINPTKPMATQRDLSLAYSPGVAVPVRRIAEDPNSAFDYTTRGNLVAVISNGTAILGLGNLGALASKPVMEGKAVLFKKFAGIDVFDIEINEKNVERLVDIIAALEPTFGGINLEDIKAPECFYVERKLRERMKIPVFHDDQHGTAIVAGAAILNGLKVVGKDVAKVKLVCSGAGAAAIACLDLMVGVGLKRENVMDMGIRPLWSGTPRVAGPAYTVRCSPGDNLMLHAAIYRAPPGSIIVVEAGDVDYAVAGGNVCAVAQKHGISAFVVDGVIRDLAEARENRFPVFARGVIPVPGGKEVIEAEQFGK